MVTAQVLLNAVVYAATTALTAVGFTLIYAPSRFFHFAHGAVFTASAYFFYGFVSAMRCPAWVAVLPALAGGIALGVVLEMGVYRPLRHRGASPLILLLASMGAYLALEHMITLVFGDETRVVLGAHVSEGLPLLGGYLTRIQLLSIVTSVSCCVIVWTWVKYSSIGLQMRAVSSDTDLALCRGIVNDKILIVAFAVGSALAALSGVLVGCDTGLTPSMGFTALLGAIVAVVAGGVGNIPGAALGAFLIGLIQNLAAWVFPAQWQDALTFIVFIMFLVAKPEGIFGFRASGSSV